MPREIRPETTLDAVEDEILYTRAALTADPDASDLLPLTDDWLPRLDETRALDRAVRIQAAEVDALRGVANGRLDAACTRFGDQLYLAVGKDRTSPRWTMFFKVAVSKFVRLALPQQVLTVQGWFAAADPVLADHRAELERWVTAADGALVRERGLAVARGENWQRRAELCEGLTRGRDGLHAALVERSQERGLDRGWPGVFFRVERSPEPSAPTPPPA
jgi:hypothetical protein